MISVIVPVLDEARVIDSFLSQFDALAGDFELLVVDGGSTDGTCELTGTYCQADPDGRRLLRAPRQRARQMNAGARQARGNILLFLHVDTLLPPEGLATIATTLGETGAVGGRFKVRMSDRRWQYRFVEIGINWRDAVSGGFTGDQAIFVERDVFFRLGGFPEIPLCEDVEFVRRLKRAGGLVSLTPPVVTSSRRYLKWGPFRTAVRMWAIKGLYLAGVPANRLSTLYPDVR